MASVPRIPRLLLTALLAASAAASHAAAAPAQSSSRRSRPMTINQSPWGHADGAPVRLYTLVNAHGLRLRMTNYGATIVSLETPDRQGRLANIVLGFDSLAGYQNHDAYFGATIGRYGNRIARARFTLDGVTYQLAANNGRNHLHGGQKGFDRRVWDAEPVRETDALGLRFTRLSPDGEEGYPGNLRVTVTYWLTNANQLKIDYRAVTDKPTVVNLTNHAYWNLHGAGRGDILDHVLLIAADQYVVVDHELIPSGELADVHGTAMDFTSPRPIGQRIAELKTDPEGPQGYDHCYVLRRKTTDQLELAARVRDPDTGRVMEIHTTEPGVQFYSGNFLNGDPKNGGYQQHAAFCLETEHFPDSPNRPEFPSVVLRPGETYHTVTVHTFRAE